MAKRRVKVSRSQLAEGTLYLRGQPFSLDDYKHMRTIYDSHHASMVLSSSRQVSKCERANSIVRLANGQSKLVKNLKPGDERISFDSEKQVCFPNKIKAVTPNGKHPIYHIQTRTDREAFVTKEHPFWTGDKFLPAEYLEEGQLIGVVPDNINVLFDRITSINILPPEETINIEMEGPHHTFLIDGLVTHNSTTLANFMATNSIAIPGFRSLYISPTVDQTKVFSHERLAPVLEQSPFLKRHYLHAGLTQNVFTKELANHSKMFLRYALLNADRIRGISADANYFDECYAPNMEVLTKDGWKDFPDVTMEDVFATSTQENILEFQKPTRVFSKHFEGNLLEFTHRSFKLTVTPGHNIFASQELNTGYYRDPKRKGWFLKTAEEMHNKNFKMTSVATPVKLQGTESFTIPGGQTTQKPNGEPYQDGRTVVFPEKQVSTPIFMEFMGWYLSEGCVTKETNRINISQNRDSEHYEAIQACLEALPISYNIVYYENKANFTISNRTLAEYLRPLGKSHQKYIPQELLEQTQYLDILLRSLYDGDAMRHQEDISQWGELNTASEQLANDVQRAWLFLGRRATIRQVTEQYNGTIMYRIRPLQRNYQIFWNAKNRVREVPYKGPVYCATVPNGTLIVRDKEEKMCVVSGNCQDLLKDIIPVVNQTMSRSLYKKNLFAGTPKTTTSTLGQLWKHSTKNEWMSKCTHCNRWNYLDEKNIGLNGPICRYCGKDLNTRRGTWVQTGKHDAPHQGFRINQLMFAFAPWVDWKKDIIQFRESHSEGIFFNEVLALSYDAGEKPVTEEDIRACCTGGPMPEEPDSVILSKPTYMGVDYGPVNSKNSNTVVAILQNQGEKIRLIYAEKFIGAKASYDYIHENIPKMFQKWGAAMIGADYGMGEAPNAVFRKALGYKKLIAYQYVPNQKDRHKYNTKMPAFTLSRSTVMTEWFQKIKNREVIFPQWEDFEPYAEDILHIQQEYNERRGLITYNNEEPDDTFHALVYGGEVALAHKEATKEYF